jgi:Phenylalanyl-tRNA synthetase alpha subunit
MDEKLKRIESGFEQDLSGLKSISECESIRIKYLGRKGLIAELFQELAALPAEQKPLFGPRINALKNKLQQEITRKSAMFEQQPELQAGGLTAQFDITLPAVRGQLGAGHPLSLVLDEICGLFIEMGFCVVEGPEIETEYYNFEALNIPLEHPSRESFDTFYLHKKYLLRSHTSPVQVRYMEKHEPPIQIVVPGKVYRPDATDASHSFMFNQVEGLLVDKNITLAHLKGY